MCYCRKQRTVHDQTMGQQRVLNAKLGYLLLSKKRQTLVLHLAFLMSIDTTEQSDLHDLTQSLNRYFCLLECLQGQPYIDRNCGAGWQINFCTTRQSEKFHTISVF